MTDLEALRKLLTRLNSEMYNWTESDVRSALYDIVSRDTVIHMCHPFGDLTGDQYYDSVLRKLHEALPDANGKWALLSTRAPGQR